MGRVFDNNVSNYLKRATVNFGLNGLTECSYAFYLNVRVDTGLTQRLVAKEQGSGLTTFRANFDPTGVAFGVMNSGATQTPDWIVAAPGYGALTRMMFTFKRNLITSADGIVYYNGISQTIATFTAGGYAAGFTMFEESNNYYCGIRQGTLVNPIDGKMGWLTIWNRQLTPAEALQDYNDPTSVTSGLLSRVQMGPDTDDIFGGTMAVNGSLVVTAIPPSKEADIVKPLFSLMPSRFPKHRLRPSAQLSFNESNAVPLTSEAETNKSQFGWYPGLKPMLRRRLRTSIPGTVALVPSTIQVDGTASLAVATTGLMIASAAIDGSSSLVIATTPLLTASGAVVGSASLVIATTPNLTASGALASSSTLVISTTANVTATAAMLASALLALSTSPVLTATVALDGSAVLVVTTTGDATDGGAVIEPYLFYYHGRIGRTHGAIRKRKGRR